jgi:alpha-methylacyl-CoA racemase
LKPLKGKRIVSLALNLPGPAALMRCKAIGADCLKLEPPAGDPMQQYSPALYARLHSEITVTQLNLKLPADYAQLLHELASADVLLTSFRPSALKKLGLDWATLHALLPKLSLVAIVGSAGERAEEPGHDLTYMAEAGLINTSLLPPTLYADMSGALLAVEAILSALLAPKPSYTEVALADAAHFMALPQAFGLTGAGTLLGGAHAGYALVPCKDGMLALAAAHAAVASWALQLTCQQAQALAAAHDVPLHALPSA